ncbi:uracil phosphoribosyltransferase [Phocaeicola sp.]
MKIINLSETDSILNRYIAELRDVTIQGDPMRFRRNVERIGEMMAYEISKTFPYETCRVKTQLSEAAVNLPACQPVIGTILRAGLPLHQGILNVFDRAENAFVSAYRQYTDEEHFDIHTEYIASPCLDGKILIITDTMLATGRSMEICYQAMLAKGCPKEIHIVSVIASRQAIDYVAEMFPEDKTTVWCGVIDPELNAHSYIVPGLGDAGDLCFGEKI